VSDLATPVEAKNEEQAFSFRQRVALWFISVAGTLAIRLIGPTLRYRVEIEPGGPPEPLLVPAVYCFWHRCVFASAYFYRNRDVAVMTSRSFDGEYIARIIQNLGFRAVRGSSSRGAVGAALMAAIGDGQYADESDFFRGRENKYTVYTAGLQYG
jgi:lysophospholipid acyltransferase (LPLAT)-like uncharacterized protein